MTTAILTDARFAGHTNPRHVERAERLSAIERSLDASGLREELLAISPRYAANAELLLAHDERYLASIRRMAEYGGGDIDADTYVTVASWEAATLAAGAAIEAVEAVLQGTCRNAFALVRPPGHHATANRAMGFCLINNIAVAARYACETLGIERLAIVDYDVHHGNGTQDIFYDDPRVLFCSTHASPLYPGTGNLNEIGSGAAAGTTLNVSLPYGVGDQGYRQVFDAIIVPALRRWQPQLILVSAGYDTHWSDPIGPMILSAQGAADLTGLLADLAAELCRERLVLVLEGGYNLDALAACVQLSLQVLLGQAIGSDPVGPMPAPEPDLKNLIATVQRLHPLLNGAELAQEK
jgi:acetoin utilization deacetylase AcuC-like enzyme